MVSKIHSGPCSVMLLLQGDVGDLCIKEAELFILHVECGTCLFSVIMYSS
jgi:hypothetical protein